MRSIVYQISVGCTNCILNRIDVLRPLGILNKIDVPLYGVDCSNRLCKEHVDDISSIIIVPYSFICTGAVSRCIDQALET